MASFTFKRPVAAPAAVATPAVKKPALPAKPGAPAKPAAAPKAAAAPEINDDYRGYKKYTSPRIASLLDPQATAEVRAKIGSGEKGVLTVPELVAYYEAIEGEEKPKGRAGRPPLSPEEKAARKAARASSGTPRVLSEEHKAKMAAGRAAANAKKAAEKATPAKAAKTLATAKLPPRPVAAAPAVVKKPSFTFKKAS